MKKQPKQTQTITKMHQTVVHIALPAHHLIQRKTKNRLRPLTIRRIRIQISRPNNMNEQKQRATDKGFIRQSNGFFRYKKTPTQINVPA